MDFGKVGKLWDAGIQSMRSSRIFTLVLSWSRHMYVEFVFDQKAETWLECHRHAFEFFGAVSGRLKIDNLKAGIIQACFDDPQVQRAYAECAEHYGFRIDPCRPRKPQHKGKVERGAMSYVKSSFVPLLPDGCTQARPMPGAGMVNDDGGEREHGTTGWRRWYGLTKRKGICSHCPIRPLKRRLENDKAVRDCHVALEKSYYSAPFRLLGSPCKCV